VADGEKLLTYLNSALKVLSGRDIFPHVPKKKKLHFVASVISSLFPHHSVLLEVSTYDNPKSQSQNVYVW
jgi:hypothetical protein